VLSNNILFKHYGLRVGVILFWQIIIILYMFIHQSFVLVMNIEFSASEILHAVGIKILASIKLYIEL